MNRCGWAEKNDLLCDYHDREWGAPLHDDAMLFEFLVLEGAQAGLSWLTILKRRDGYRRAFDGFDARKVAGYTMDDVSRLLDDDAIIRNRLKVNSAVTNARAFLQVQEEWGSFDRYVWRFTRGRTILNAWKSMSEIPSRSPESDAMSRDLQKRGFKFVGTTICYAFMQAVGLVNDHLVSCFRYEELKRMQE